MELIKERFPGIVSDISSDGEARFLADMIRDDTSGKVSIKYNLSKWH